MKNLNGEISGIKAKRLVKFNKRYNTLYYFVLKDNKLYHQVFKFGQPKKLVLCNYSAANIIKKIHTQLKHIRK